MSSAKPVDHLVLIVHGVGDPMPGETLSLFARSVAGAAHPLDEHQEVLWLREERQPRFVDTFPAHIRFVTSGGKTTEAAEVFWGDLSRVKRSLVGVILGIIQVFFGLRYVAHQAADGQRGWAAKVLKWLGIWTADLLQGPVAAVNIVLAALTFVAVAMEQFATNAYRQAVPSNWCVLAAGLVLLIVSVVAYRFFERPVTKKFFVWVAISAIGMGAAVGLRFWMAGNLPIGLPGVAGYAELFVSLLGFLWLVLTLTMALMFFVFIPAWLTRYTNKPGIIAALLLPALTLGIWGVVIPTVWWFASHNLPVVSKLPEFSLLFNQAVPLLSLQWLMAALVTACLIVVLLFFYHWHRTSTVSDYKNRRLKSPRLILNGWVQLAIAMTAIMGISAVLIIAAYEILGTEPVDQWLGGLLTKYNPLVLSIIPVLGAVAVMILPLSGAAFDIILDVVNHFFFVKEGGELKFTKRQAINNRMKTLLRHFASELKTPCELTIMSHSQGSMIAAEALPDLDEQWIEDHFSKVTFVTMGSPIFHLYQHYFGHKYPDDHWRKLGARINDWINIFRVDDYVGTHQDPRFSDPSQKPPVEVSENPVPPKGHTFYWNDETVLQVLSNKNVTF